jgi:positive regulator of sigma E activity
VERIGTVMTVDPAHAQLQIEPIVCAQCPTPGGCVGFSGARGNTLVVPQPTVPLQPGQRVRVTIDEGRVWRSLGGLCVAMTLGGAMLSGAVAAWNPRAIALQALAFALGAAVVAWRFPPFNRDTRFDVIS